MRKALSDSLWSGRVLHVGALGILLFLMGGYWDVAWHIDLGRDTFWSPPHLLIYAGVLLLLGSLALGFGEAWRRRASGRPPRAGPALRLPGGVWMSPGLVMAGLGALMSLTSAPVDELWHWVYGQDVTIWSPPHLQLIFGVALGGLGLLAAHAGEMNRADPSRLRPGLRPLQRDPRQWMLVFLGALVTSALLATVAEYEFDIPRFPVVYHPIVLAPVAVGSLMLAARALGTAWAATAVAGLVTALSLGALAELALLGRTRPTIPLILAAGLAIDLLWRRVDQSERLRAAAPVAAAATLTLLAAEVPWKTLIGGTPWPVEVWPLALPAALLAGTTSGAVGARLGAALRPVPHDLTAPLAGEAAGQARTPDAGARRPRVPLGRGLTTLFVLLVALNALPPTARAQASPPEVRFHLPRPEVEAGRPLVVEFQVAPSALPTDTWVWLEREQIRVPGAVEPLGNGWYRTTLTPTKAGHWWAILYLPYPDERWVAYFRLRAGPEGGPVANAADPRPLVLPSRELAAKEVPALQLLVGKLLAWSWMGALLGLAALTLRTVQRDGLRVARAATPPGSAPTGVPSATH